MKITSAHGTPEQFEAAVRKRIQELNKEDEIITSAADPDTEIADRDEYITALYHELKAAAPDSISINIEDEGDDSISFVASDGDRVVSFKVPYADMKFDWTHFEDDVDYILTAVNEEFAADGMSDTHNTDAASNILASDDNSEINKLNDHIETAFEDIGLPFNKIKHTTDNSFIVEPKENREFTFTDLGEIEEELHRLLSNYDIETSLTDTSNIIITFTLYEEDIEIPRQRGLGYLDKYVEITNEKPSGIPYKVGDIVKGHKILAYLKPKKGYKLKARNNYPLFLTRDTFDNDYVEILIHYNDEPEKDFFTNVSFDDFEVIGESLKASDDDDFSDPLEAAQQSFEYGHYAEENDFKSAEDYAQYLEYMDMGPEGFYEEFKDDLDFDDMFVEEYEYDE